MDKEAQGTVISVTKQWWLKINTKPVRAHALDGAIFPHVVKVRYTIDGKEYFKRKWIRAGKPTPKIGDVVTVAYREENPKKAVIKL
ncbi:MAG: sugar ABC transporter permease [Clostridia bacterium]|nr:sugar ABC transporter permease [Clostridia bacterium]